MWHCGARDIASKNSIVHDDHNQRVYSIHQHFISRKKLLKLPKWFVLHMIIMLEVMQRVKIGIKNFATEILIWKINYVLDKLSSLNYTSYSSIIKSKHSANSKRICGTARSQEPFPIICIKDSEKRKVSAAWIDWREQNAPIRHRTVFVKSVQIEGFFVSNHHGWWKVDPIWQLQA